MSRRGIASRVEVNKYSEETIAFSSQVRPTKQARLLTSSAIFNAGLGGGGNRYGYGAVS
jgi:hypothetical protein